MERAGGSGENPPYVADFHRFGFAVVRHVFTPDEVALLARAFDDIWAQGMEHPRSYRHGNVFFRVSDDRNLGRIVRYVQWPSYFDSRLDAVRSDRRMLNILQPLIGRDIKQIINQMHWKPPGAAMADFGWHQDIRFRRPRSAYREPGESYVQTAIAIDPHRLDNGAMRMCSGSHRLGEVDLGPGRIMDRALDGADLAKAGLDPRNVEALVLEPGDVALWHLYTLHGSGPNHTSGDRRLYINGYVKASMCERGEWTFRDGQPLPLGNPVLVHFEDLFRRPEPHYVDD
ncbi:MAG: phytanoyl-CoA dioxygenase family protein [Rhodospirillales bacterium]|nr:phytanoyl-CoA dioxygenase family protein [Rhodospirillales bacterium]